MKQTWTHGTWQISTTTAPDVHTPHAKASAPPWSAVAAAVQLQAGLGASGRRHACSLERLRPVRPSSWARAARCLLPGRLGAGREVPGRRATREGGAAAEQRAAEPECLGAAAWGGGSVGGGGGGVRQAERPRCEAARGKGAGSGARFTVSLGNRRNSSKFFVFGDGWEPNFGGKFEEFLSKFKKFKKIILISEKFRY